MDGETAHILILTPVAPNTIVAPCTLPYSRLFSEMAPSLSLREANININRARLQRMFNMEHLPNYKFVLLMDSDVVTDTESVEKLVSAWKPGITPCINTKGDGFDHIVTSCALISANDYVKVDYTAKLNECQCRKLPCPFYVEGTHGYEVTKKGNGVQLITGWNCPC